MNIERKNFDTFVKADPDGTIEAVVSVFGNTDRGKEVVKHGAFAKSISRKLPKGVWSHDWTQPVAKTLEARELSPGDPLLPTAISAFGGLYVKGQFNLETQAGAEAYSNIKFGIIDEFSIGYTVVKDSVDEKSSVRELHEVDLFEWSPVLVGMNDATQLLSIKGETSDRGLKMKFVDHSEAVLAANEEFVARVKDLCALRIAEGKEGRMINAANRSRIQACIDGLTELLAMADPAKAADADVRRMHAAFLKTLSTA